MCSLLNSSGTFSCYLCICECMCFHYMYLLVALHCHPMHNQDTYIQAKVDVCKSYDNQQKQRSNATREPENCPCQILSLKYSRKIGKRQVEIVPHVCRLSNSFVPGTFICPPSSSNDDDQFMICAPTKLLSYDCFLPVTD